jgi:HD superfamily phosphohydrolase
MEKALTVSELRDPIHGFVRLDSDEVRVVNSREFQRLRNIHQLALTYNVYPGASHKRFEHCLGVMEVASRIYDVVTNDRNVLADSEIRSIVPKVGAFDWNYWRRVLRMAALCHDLGHLPFSHAAEDLLPDGISHEDLSYKIITGPGMEKIWRDLKVQATDVAKIAVGPKHSPESLGVWEAILSEMIIGDTFGADRIDYLLRDSHHAGVQYGRFDHYRLIDTIRILPKADAKPPSKNSTQQSLDFEELIGAKTEASKEPTLGIEQGGIQSSEALLWARYFMWTQVYLHHVRQVYDLHLADFLRAWLPEGKFSIEPSEHIKLSDNEVNAAMAIACRDENAPGHSSALCVLTRGHFRRIYEENFRDRSTNLQAFDLVKTALEDRYGKNRIKSKRISQKKQGKQFPVLMSSGICENSINLSSTLESIPVVSSAFLFVQQEVRDEAMSWLSSKRNTILGA